MKNINQALFEAAISYLDQKLNVIAVDQDKRAIMSWKEFNSATISIDILRNQLQRDNAAGIAIICGPISGNLEVIDFDLKNDITGNLMERYLGRISQDLKTKLYFVRTRTGGYHIYYRCSVIKGNTKLASRPATEEERKASPHLKQVVLIETRGSGGYVVAPPTYGYTLKGNSVISTISESERQELLQAARSFMEVRECDHRRLTKSISYSKSSPFDDFNSRANAIQLLEKYGWTIVNEDKSRIYLKRPGRTSSPHSANFHKSKNLFKVWSTSTNFCTEKAYTPAGVYTMLVHNGNYSEAARDLIKQGFGRR